jgi:hypothetical protein
MGGERRVSHSGSNPTAAVGAYFLPPMMRNNFVPQSGQTPCMAGRPFFMVTSWALAISFFALHFTQYASATVIASLLIQSSLGELQANLTTCGAL